ncbi:MAG: hypothetical protein M3Z66_04995 [Chloroflexota bacterium]|nr:hypothetical protein [Chloroflexota bacterium]
MKSRLVAASIATFLFIGAGTGLASAHANLLRATIKNNEVFKVGHTPKVLQGFFAQDLDSNPNRTWMAIFEGVADHGLVTEKQHSVVNFRNPKEMTVKLPRLAPDMYYIIWYTHSAVDGHYAAGIVYFSVKK